MFRSSGLRIGIGVVAVLVVLGLLRFKPWERPETPAPEATAGSEAAAVAVRKQLEVGYLPVT